MTVVGFDITETTSEIPQVIDSRCELLQFRVNGGYLLLPIAIKRLPFGLCFVIHNFTPCRRENKFRL